VVVVADRYQIPLKHETNTRVFFNEQTIQKFTSHSALQVLDLFLPSAFILEKKIMGYGVGTDGGGGIQLRGLGGKPNTGVLVLINGHPDFMGVFGHPLPDVYGMDDIESVEVLSGPSSTVFGSNAMGGVVNLKLKNDYSHPLNIKLEGGSHGTYGWGIKYAQKFNDTGISISLNKKSSQGHIAQTSFQSTQINGSVEQKINDVFALSANVRYVPYRFDDPARINDAANLGTYGIINRGMGDLILRNHSEKITGSTQLYVNMGSHKFYDNFKSEDFTYGASIYQQYALNEKVNIAAGGEYIKYGGKNVTSNSEYGLTTYGAYGLAVYTPVPELSLKSGLRVQHHSLGITKLSPMAGIAFSPHYSIRLFANYQTGYRIPTIRDLYLFPTSNENLDEESVESLEFGFEYFVLNRGSIRFSYYRNNVENIILPVFNPDGPPPIKFQNSGNAIQNGIEATTTYQFNEKLSAQFSYSYLDSGELSAFNPKHQLKYMIEFNFDGLQFSLFGKYVQDLFTGNNSQGRLPDYHLLNTSVGYSIFGYDLSLRVFNILDREYLTLTDYPAPGRYFVLGLNFSI